MAVIGTGGMGEVYRPHDTKLSRDVKEGYLAVPGANFGRTYDVSPDGSGS